MNFKLYFKNIIVLFLFVYSNSYGQCSYPTGATSVGTYTFCIDNSNSITTASLKAGQYVLLNVVNGFTYTFSVGNVFTTGGNANEILSLYDNSNIGITTASSASGATISTWTATYSGQAKILLSRGGSAPSSCVNDGSTGGILSLTLVSLGNTQDSPTAYGTDSWTGHIYNYTGSVGTSPSSPSTTTNPFLASNYAGYYTESESFYQEFSGSGSAVNNYCFPVLSNSTNLVNIDTDTFAVRYRMKLTKPAGCYIATFKSDDGVRLYVDNALKYDNWNNHGIQTTYAMIYLTGNSDLIYDYYENTGLSQVGFSMSSLSSLNTVIQPTQYVCTPSSSFIDGSSFSSYGFSAGTITYQWKTSTSSTGPFVNCGGTSTGEDYTVSPVVVATAGTGNITNYYKRVVTSNVNAGCVYDSNVISITTSPSTPATPAVITGSTAQCAGNTLQTYSIAVVANAISYNWTLPANWTITAGAGTNSITVSIASNGATGNVSVNAINGCGTSGSYYLWVTVSTPTVAGIVTPDNTNVCSGNSTNLRLSGNTASILRWESSTDNFAGGPITTIVSSIGSTVITASNITVDTYYRAVVQNGGCNLLYSNSVKITVVGAMVDPGLISINGGPGISLYTTNCASTTMTFSIATIANATSYTWTVGAGWTIVSGQGTASVSVTTGNTSQSSNIIVYATNGTCPQTSARYLWVALTNTATPTGTAVQSFCSGATVANLAATGTMIQWYAAASGGSPLATTTVLVNGTHYYATQIIGSCESSSRFDVTVNANPTISGTVTPATCSSGSDGSIIITGLNVPIEFKKADNDYIDLGSSFLSNKSAFTIEGWVKFNIADVGSRMSLFGQNDVIEFFLDTNIIQLWTPGGGSVSTPLTAAIGNNAWHHIAATGNGTNIKIYIDGGLVGTGGISTTNYGSSTYNAQIGSGVVDQLTTIGGGFTGQIEKVGFYSTALAVGTISTLAISTTTYLGSEAGLIAGYNFFEGLGTVMTSLPAGKNGTFGNSPQWAYTYAWTKTGTPGYTASTKDISSLSPGDYNLTITTLGGCLITKTFTVGYTNTVPSTPTAGTPTQPNCTTATGSVVLSGLSASGTIGQTGTATASYTITGTTMTISGLAVGSYTFTASNGFCTSSATSNVVINAVVTNTWNGTTWDNLTPNNSQKLVFNGNYPPASDPNVDITGCSCTVNTGKNVIIKTGRNLIITNEVTVSGTGTLTFDGTSSLVQTNNASVNSGNIIYKRTSSSVLTSDYTYWSSPVAGQNLSISPSYASGLFYSYNDFAIPEDWKKETASTVMLAGKGYIIRGPQITGIPPPPSLYDATFTGVPNNGINTIAIGPTGTSNLLGNPYPSAINADTFLSVNSSVIEGTIYFWTHNTAIQSATNIGNNADGTPKAGSGVLAYTSDDYASYNGTGAVAVSGGIIPTGKIAAGQAFFTTSKSTGGLATFNNAMRLTGTTLVDKTGINQQFFKTTNTKAKTATTVSTTSIVEKDRIWLNLTNNQGAFKQTLVGYVTDATNDYDSRFDGVSLDGNDYIDFYSVLQNKNLTIQGRTLPFDENDIVPLGFSSTIDGDFTINIDQVDGLLIDQAVFIEDKLTNTIVDLKNGDYTFTIVAGTFNDRFVLRYTNKTLGTNDFTSNENKVLVSVKSKQIKVNSFAETIDKVTVYDLLGRQIYQKINVNSNELSIADLVASHQTLLIKTTLQKGKTVSDKIIF